MVMLTDRPMRKVKLNLILKESEMAQVIILQMNGDKVEKSLNYLPQGKPFYNIVSKGDKQVKLNTAEETLSWLKEHEKEDKTYYIKIPSGFHTVGIESLRIA